MDIFSKIFDLAINQNASDIHFQTGEKPIIRVNSKLLQVEDAETFNLPVDSPEIKGYLNQKQFNTFIEHGNADFAFDYNPDYRFRGNIYRQRNGISISLRLLRSKILTFEQLSLPPVFQKIATDYRQGFFLIVGPTGQGKSTSLAAILNHINATRESHIITIEDPIEYILKNNKSVIEQREVGSHTSTFSGALRASMRQDPDVIMIGEMRDIETMQAAVTLAETGHLVFSTMHTNDAVQTIDRIIDAFPDTRQKQVRIQLASALSGVISQRLVPSIDGGLVFAYEQLLVNDAIRNIIRTSKNEQIYNALQGSEEAKGGVLRLEQSLAQLVKDQKITREMAESFAVDRDLVNVFMQY